MTETTVKTVKKGALAGPPAGSAGTGVMPRGRWLRDDGPRRWGARAPSPPVTAPTTPGTHRGAPRGCRRACVVDFLLVAATTPVVFGLCGAILMLPPVAMAVGLPAYLIAGRRPKGGRARCRNRRTTSSPTDKGASATGQNALR